jgi:two-component sensor histidine kinase/Tfp pilus assembly protein PilF
MNAAWKKRSANLDTSIVLVNEVLSALNRMSDESLQANWKQRTTSKAYYYLGHFYDQKGEIEKSFGHYTKALAIANTINDPHSISLVNGGMGTFYLNQGNYPKALEHYYTALKMDEKRGYKEGISVRLSNIGTVYDSQGNYDKALEYYLRAIKILEELKDKKHISVQLGNIGIVYYEKKDLAKAKQYYERAISIDREQGSKNGISRNLNNIGTIYKDENNNEKALACFTEGLQLARDQGNQDLEATHLGNMGSIYRVMGKMKPAEEMLLKAIAIDKEIGSLEAISEFEHELSLIYEQQGKYDKAYEHYRKHISARDTVFNIQNAERNVRQELNYDFEKKQAIEKTKHAEEMLVMEEKNKTQKQFRIFLFVIIGLILFILFMLKRAYDNKKKLADFLAAESDHKEMLLQEVHHRVNNNFQIISSLLTLQGSGAENEKLSGLLEQSQGRIQSLSALHELLYQKDSLLDVNMREYLQKVLDYHNDLLSTKHFKVTIETDITPVVFSTKLAVPVALIVNELVTNSMKYAFADNEKGMINVTMREETPGNGQWILTVSDNGSGVKTTGNSTRESMGLRLVNMMAKQIKAKMSMESSPGLSYRFIFKAPAYIAQTKKEISQITG